MKKTTHMDIALSPWPENSLTYRLFFLFKILCLHVLWPASSFKQQPDLAAFTARGERMTQQNRDKEEVEFLAFEL